MAPRPRTWRGQRGPGAEALHRSWRTREPAPRPLGRRGRTHEVCSRQPRKENGASRLGRRDAAPLRRSSGSQPEGRPRSAASASPAPPTGRTEQAQPGPGEFLWGWGSAGRTPRGSSRRWAGPCRRAGAHVTATALGIGRWTKSGPSTLSRSTWRWQGR